MSDYILVHWTCGSIEEARKVSRFLVQERYVASANIVPWVESLYMLDNALDTTQETRVLFKTRAENFEAVKEVIIDNSSYEIPEVLSTKIENGNNDYLQWLEESTLEVSKAQI